MASKAVLELHIQVASNRFCFLYSFGAYHALKDTGNINPVAFQIQADNTSESNEYNGKLESICPTSRAQ